MKTLIYPTCLLILSSCSLFKSGKKKSTENVETTTEVSAENEIEEPKVIVVSESSDAPVMMAYHEICDQFLLALQSGSMEPLSTFAVTPALARILSPKETAELTDKQIQETMISGLQQRFLDNLNKLRQAAKDNSVDLNKLRVQNCLYFESDDPPTVPRVLSIELESKGNVFKIPVTILSHEKKTYVFEILKTTGVFDKP